MSDMTIRGRARSAVTDAATLDEARISNRELALMTVADRHRELRQLPADVELDELAAWEPTDLAELSSAE